MREGTPVPLTPKAFDTLVMLVENRDRVVEKDEMMKAIWPDSFVEERNLAQNVFTLRKALGEDTYIETVPRRGYRFAAGVREVERESEDLIVAKRVTSHILIEEEAAGAEFDAPALPAARGSWLSGHRLLAVLLGFGLLAALVTAYLVMTRWSDPPGDVAAVKSIAVLPFNPLVATGTDDYLGTGMADALITRLGSIRQLVVRPTRSVLKYTSLEKDLLVIGRELRVEAVLDGKIQRNGERIRVTVQLVRVSDGSSLWEGTFDERFTDMFALQDAISDRVEQAMRVKLTGEERERRATHQAKDPEAYEAYLKGRYFWNKRSEEGLRKGREYFDEAIKRDPTFAPAYVGLAECYALFSTYGVMPASEAFPKAEQAALKALEFDERIAEAHASLGVIRYEYNWDWPGADKEFRRAIELNPNYATAHQWYGSYLVSVARFDEGIREIKRAQELDPLSPIINASIGWFCYFARRYDEAIEEGKRAVALEGNSVMAHFFLGQAYLQKKMYTEAIAELEKSNTLSPREPQILSVLTHAYSLAGKKREAERVLEEILGFSRRGYVPAYNIAEAYLGVGDKDRAFEWLEKAFAEHSPDLVGLKTEPRLDVLRSDPRFASLIARVGLP
jgi:TolB-like protein/DNA-binding winged helix-turn-helix (wHTH) protein/tetratricopeptide (TPR) repeat protein